MKPKIVPNLGRIPPWHDFGGLNRTGQSFAEFKPNGSKFSRPRGEVPQDRPVHINEVLATIYHQLGVSTDHVHYLDGRPVPVLYEGKPIPELI